MSQIWKDFCKQAVSSTTGSPTTAFTLGAAASGFQALGSGDDGKTGFFAATEGSTWETFWGTYTHSGTSLAVTSFIASSSGSALSFTSAAVVKLDVVSQAAQAMMLASQATPPGGRLTLTSGTPVTTADVTAATNVYYTPYLNNVIALWDGKIWSPTVFVETTLALGTLTSGQAYDVFAFLSSGALSTELLAWTDTTARATGISLQDGRYCKTGDKTRLYLGSFLTTATTTTEDSFINRFLFNMYNRLPRVAKKSAVTTHTYTSSTERNWDNSTTETACNFMLGVLDHNVAVRAYGEIGSATSQSVNATIIPRLNGVSYSDSPGQFYLSVASSSLLSLSPTIATMPVLGLNGAILREADFTGGLGGTYQNAMMSVQFFG